MLITDAAYYMRLFEAIYGTLEGLNVAGYRYKDSDSWSQARIPAQWDDHLDCWVDLGSTIERAHSHILKQGYLLFGVRHIPTDSSKSMSIAHAAIRDAEDALMEVHMPNDCRITSIGLTTIQKADPDGDTNWLTIQIPFTLYLPRG